MGFDEGGCDDCQSSNLLHVAAVECSSLHDDLQALETLLWVHDGESAGFGVGAAVGCRTTKMKMWLAVEAHDVCACVVDVFLDWN